MQRNTSVILGDHFSNFIAAKIGEGRYESTSEAVRAGLRLLEKEEAKLDALRKALSEGEESGIAEYSFLEIIEQLDS